MVDPGAAQAIVKQLNRWYRQRAKPHGTLDYFQRGTRMTYTASYRLVTGLVAACLLAAAVLLCFVPGWTAGKSPAVTWLLKSGWGGMVAVAVLLLLRAFREHTIITDDGLLKSDLFGRKTRVLWGSITRFQVKPDDNQVIFRTQAKTKLTLSLSYDGWQDFMDLAANRLDPAILWQLRRTLASLKPSRPPARPATKGRWGR